MSKKNVAIIGAGLSGLTLAEALMGRADVTLFEKARGIGGRMSTRYSDDFQFDHGAQYFTARSEGFKNFIQPFIDQNIVQEWTPKVVTLEADEKPYKRDWFEAHYTAAPKMNMLCKAIAKNHDVRIKTKIETLTQSPAGWILSEEHGGGDHGPFDWVVSAAPAPQAAALLPDDFVGHANIDNVQMQGCYSLMLGFKQALKLNWGAAKVKNSPIGWMAVDSAKPSREGACSVLVQTTNEWAQAHIDDDQDDVRDLLMREASALLECDAQNADYISLHRWRYANTITHDEPKQDGYFLDESLNLAACGDWCVKGHVESAYLSATSLARALEDKL